MCKINCEKNVFFHKKRLFFLLMSKKNSTFARLIWTRAGAYWHARNVSKGNVCAKESNISKL